MRKVSFFTPRKTLKIKTNMVQVIICSIKPSTKYPEVEPLPIIKKKKKKKQEDAFPTYPTPPRHHGRSDYSNHMHTPIKEAV